MIVFIGVAFLLQIPGLKTLWITFKLVGISNIKYTQKVRSLSVFSKEKVLFEVKAKHVPFYFFILEQSIQVPFTFETDGWFILQVSNQSCLCCTNNKRKSSVFTKKGKSSYTLWNLSVKWWQSWASAKNFRFSLETVTFYWVGR